MASVKVVCTECGDPAEAHDVLHFKGEIKSGFCGPTVFTGECVICSWDCLNTLLDRGLPVEEPEPGRPVELEPPVRGVSLRSRPTPPPLPEEREEEDRPEPEEFSPPMPRQVPLPPPPPPVTPLPPVERPTGERRRGRRPHQKVVQATPVAPSRTPVDPASVDVSGLPSDVRDLFETPKPTIKPGLPHSKETVQRHSSSSAEPFRAQLEASIRDKIARETGDR